MKRTIAFVTLICFFFTQVVWSAESAIVEKKVLPAEKKIFIPNHLGMIVDEKYLPGTPRIVCIQDPHANYIAQKNEIQIINHLEKEYGARKIFLEGAAGKLDLDRLRNFPDREVKKDISDLFLGNGLMNAAEYCALNDETPLEVYGIEKPSLYLKNVTVFKKILHDRLDMIEFVDRALALLDSLQQVIHNERLYQFEKRYSNYRGGKSRIIDYVTVLQEWANNDDLLLYPEIRKYLSALQFRKKVHFDTVTDDVKRLLQHNRTRYSKEEAYELLEMVLRYRLGKISPLTFYRYLKYISEKKGGFGGIENLQRYYEYISRNARIDNLLLIQEIEALSGHIKERLYKTEDERIIDKLLEFTELLKSVSHLQIKRRQIGNFLERKYEFIRAFWEYIPGKCK